MWDYCILSKLDIEKSSKELDEGDQMHLDNFDILAEFVSKYNSLPAEQENEIMDLFKYFIGRDMLLLAAGDDKNNENTQLESDGEIENMETESIMHDTLSKCEQWYLKFKANHGKEVYSLLFE